MYLGDLEALGIDSIIVKVAAIGLGRKHLGARGVNRNNGKIFLKVILLRHFTHPFITGQKLADVRGHLEQLQAKFGVHPAGEGHTVLLVN